MPMAILHRHRNIYSQTYYAGYEENMNLLVEKLLLKFIKTASFFDLWYFRVTNLQTFPVAVEH